MNTTQGTPFPAPREGSDNPTIPPPGGTPTRPPDPTTFVWPEHPEQRQVSQVDEADRPTPNPSAAPGGIKSDRPRRTWTRPRSLLALLALTVVVGTGVFVATKRPRNVGDESHPNENSHGNEASTTEAVPNWIGSGRYKLPGGIAPGLYRVGRHYTIYDHKGGVVIQSPATVEGTTLLVIREDVAAGAVEIVGGAWPLIADGPVDPTRFRDGMYLVGYDIQPGTYQVDLVPSGAGVASATRLDDRNQVIQTEQVTEADGIHSVVIIVEPTDFGLSFIGEINKIG